MNWRPVVNGEVYYDEKGKIVGRVYGGMSTDTITAYISFAMSSNEKNIGQYISKHYAKTAVEEKWAEFSKLRDELETADWKDFSHIVRTMEMYYD